MEHTPSIATTFASLEHNPVALWLRTSLAYPVLEILHIIGLATLFGSLLIVELCLLGIIREVHVVDLARRVFRFAWHAMSLLMLVSAATVVWPGTPRALILLVGAAWLAVGLADALYTRGRHIGWPILTASGVFAILGATA